MPHYKIDGYIHDDGCYCFFDDRDDLNGMCEDSSECYLAYKVPCDCELVQAEDIDGTYYLTPHRYHVKRLPKMYKKYLQLFKAIYIL